MHWPRYTALFVSFGMCLEGKPETEQQPVFIYALVIKTSWFRGQHVTAHPALVKNSQTQF
jgi:hypothetical protein